MAAQDLFIIVNVPSIVPEELRQRLVTAHPRAEVVLVDDPEHFAALLPRADAALLLPPMAPLLGPALAPAGTLCSQRSRPPVPRPC